MLSGVGCIERKRSELGRLLEELASAPLPGVVVLTSRFPLPTLAHRRYARILALGALDAASARALLTSVGVVGPEAELERHILDVLPRLAYVAEITGAHFCRADMEASTVVPAERQGRPTTVPQWIVIIEGSDCVCL